MPGLFLLIFVPVVGNADLRILWASAQPIPEGEGWARRGTSNMGRYQELIFLFAAVIASAGIAYWMVVLHSN
jgi:hypothetical protein